MLIVGTSFQFRLNGFEFRLAQSTFSEELTKSGLSLKKFKLIQPEYFVV